MRTLICTLLLSLVIGGSETLGQQVPRINSQDRNPTKVGKKPDGTDADLIIQKLRDSAKTRTPSGVNKQTKPRDPAVPPRSKNADDPRKQKDPSTRLEPKLPLVPRQYPKPTIPLRPNLPNFGRPLNPNRSNEPGTPGAIGSSRRRQFDELKELQSGLLHKEFDKLPDLEEARTGHSFRIATFNTHLISPIFNKDLFDSGHADADAHTVANAIAWDAQHLHSFDVIVLNEVWDEDAEDILETTLAPIFPYYVKKMEAPDGTTAHAQVSGGTIQVPILEDSGMMLFSKLPFDTFKVGTPSKVVDRTFHWFDTCSGVDAAAAKGVGAVVLYHKQADRHYLVAFTHLQDGDAEVRSSQMSEIQGFIASLRSLNPEVRRGETFLLGDLNIQGVNMLEKADPTWTAADEKQQEWVNQFLKPQSYFFFPLYDGWSWTTSATDSGFTNPGGNERLDYIIHEREPGEPKPYVIQHIHHVLAGTTDSDHVAVAADLNLASPGSVPRLARRPEQNKSKPLDWWDSPLYTELSNVTLSGEIAYPGSMQWYRFDEGGTFSIGLPTALVEAGLAVTVYQANDLSHPIAVYNKEMTTVFVGKDPPMPYEIGKYHLGEPPFFVRVSNPHDRTWHGKYDIVFHRHRGANKMDSITLHPGEPLTDPRMPTTKPLNAEDTVWFEFVTDRAHSNKPQDIEILVDNKSVGKLTMDLLEQDPNDPESTIKIVSTGLVDQPNLKLSELGDKKYYLNVTRNAITQENFFVGWRTNLTWLVGLGIPGVTWPFKLVCTDETDWDSPGSDEIVFQIFVDGQLYSKEYFDDVDTGDHYSYEGLIQPVAFLEKVEPTICEIGAVDDPDCSQGIIVPLKVDQSKDLRKEVYLYPDDGNYEFRYNLSHWLNK